MSLPLVITVGSRIRFSTGLLQQIDKEPDHRSRVVEIERIVEEADGSLTLWVKNAAGVMDGIA